MTDLNLLESLSDNIVIDKTKCTFCGICIETCILDNLRMKLAPCRGACPLGVNCHGYVQLIARGEEDKALELLRETNPFPGILGRICAQPCEAACHRKVVTGEGVAIRALKRYLTEIGGDTPIPNSPPSRDSGQRVAIIGSGPTGLMAALDLRLKGHGVNVFEAEDEPGGMLRWAIPEFRLPLPVLEQETNRLKEMGVQFECGVALGRDRSLANLKTQFDAIVIAIGCGKPISLNLKGEELPEIYYGLPFLRGVRAGQPPAVGKTVIVIGGGNVALDSAQTAFRLGASDVTMVCLESREEMPAFAWALEEALTEGIKLDCSWGPVRFLSENGRLKAVELQVCKSVFDHDGAFCPSFESSQTKTLPADTIILAVGQRRDVDSLEKAGLTVEGLRIVDPLTLQTSDEMIFLAGDVYRGPTSVVQAMADGRAVAESVHRWLMREDLHYGRSYRGPVETEFEIDVRTGSNLTRRQIPRRLIRGQGDFSEVEMAFDEATARQEAGRCYSCGEPFGKFRTCWFCLPCEIECPHEALRVDIPYLLK
jgi:NADPH-dependent glutamate synthase beta subunit-like oxidoreductase